MKKVINAYFSGSGFEIKDTNFMASQFYKASISAENQINFGFDGCAIAYKLGGMLWGTGLDEQCQKVIGKIETELKAGHEITLNVYGHSRGAIAALLLAKQLGQVDPSLLEINLALLDPVPGNLITTSTLDFLDISLANKVMDLSDCKPLKNVLALYPYLALADYMCHAPLFPTYPRSANIDEDVTFGSHSQAEYIEIIHPISSIPAKRFYDFLTLNGSKFKNSALPEECYYDTDLIKKLYDELLPQVTASTRAAHSADRRYIEVRSSAEYTEVNYVNRHHQKLAGIEDNPSTRLTSIKHSKGIISRLLKVEKSHPLASNLIQWGMIGVGLSGVFLLTGVFSDIPLLATLMSTYGSANVFLGASALLALSAPITWKCIILPTLTWAAERFYYPHYKILATESNTQKDRDEPMLSSTQIMQKLGIQSTHPKRKLSLNLEGTQAHEFNNSKRTPVKGLHYLLNLELASKAKESNEIEITDDFSLTHPHRV